MASPEEMRASERALPVMAAVRPYEHEQDAQERQEHHAPAALASLLPPQFSPASFLEPDPQPAPPLHALQPRFSVSAAPAARPSLPSSSWSSTAHEAARTLSELPYLDAIRRTPSNSSLQSHHLRHSPPLQPGEQRAMGQTDKLPSFKQLMANVTEPSPPCTPARKSASMENSPVSRGPPPTFGEPSWNDSAKRRRIDSASAYSSEALPALPLDSGMAESRRSAVVDPALSAPYADPRSHQPVGHPQGHHRPSLSFSLHPGSSGPSSHVRHQSTPSYSQEARAPYPYGPSSAGSTPSYPPPSYPATYGDHRSSYYPNPHSDPRSSDPYYGQPQSGHAPQPSSYAPPPPSSYAQQHSSSYPPPPSSTYPPQHPSSYTPQPPSSYAPQLQHSSYDNGYHPQSQSGYNNFHIQQSSMNVDQNVLGARKRRGNLPKEATSILKNWFADHRESPYPTEEEKLKLCSRTNLSINQVSNWFINARRRAPQKEQRDAQAAEMSQ